MASSLPLGFNSYNEQNLRRRLSHLINQDRLFRAIDDDISLVGAGVMFIDSRGTAVTLREFEPLCFIKPVNIVLREPPIGLSASTYISEVKNNPRESRIVSEAAGAVLSCGAAALSWFVVFTSGAAIPFSGGSSSVFTVMAYGAAAASSIQCGNSIMRTRNEIVAPNRNDELDSELWYQNATMALDIISIGGATTAGLMTIRGIKVLNASGIPTREALQGLNRQQRRRLSREIARSNAPGISNSTLKMMERAGQIERRYSNAAIQATTLRQIKDATGAGLAYAGSALGGSFRQLAIVVVKEE
ncbi:NAD synthetase [Alkalimonas amylolytica]|uniref:NAD synthetase n=1 Tax=Alkalimonas amylolytica TaxID=152573 RepID=A0A1H4BR94_ALKAM|nr:NAD synthetase [Alkalimonas amylolytica]SEA50628.1 hypothetical protein SAMN04488051_103483 [Alkalimonas amylolytica]